MDHAIKEAAVSTTVTARASLPVRIAIAVIAAISVIVGVLGIVNLASVSNYNQATDSLNANIKASQQQDADFDKLQTQQQQTDAQFDEAGRMRTLLLPQVKDAIDTNASISSELTKITLKQAEAQNSGSDSGQAQSAQQSENSSSNAKKGGAFGSTRRGIAYAYGDKYMKKTLRMGDLLHLDDAVKKRLITMVDAKNLVMEGSYHSAPISVDEMWAWLEKYAAIFKDYICDVGQYLADADAAGKKVLFEAQLGALRDIDFGIYPYTTSSNVIGAYAPIGAGIPGHKLTNSIGVMKAYSSCVGDGPFVTELAMTEEEKHALREAGHEYGAATGRPRRVGPIDLVASHYGVFCQGCDEVALTLLDVLDYMEKIPMVTGYKLTDGTITKHFPMGMALDTAQPVVEYLPGWHCDITAARKWEDLPQEARDYVEYLEKAIGCKITYISVGAEREAYIHHV